LVQRHVSAVTLGEIREIYKTMYWDKVDGDELPIGVDYVVFDAAVNSGPVRGIRWLQQGVNKCAGFTRLKVDEKIGPATLDASDDYDFEKLIDAMLDARLGFMKIARNTKTGAPSWPVFGNGWQNRLFGYLPKGAKVRHADGVDDISKMMVRNAVAASRPTVPQVELKDKVPLLPVPYQPQPNAPVVRQQLGVSGWAAILAALGVAVLGAVQWQH
jgi:lysozyme family protein